MKLVHSAILIGASIAATAAASAAPVSYTLDPNHTYVLFSWSHLGFSHPTGQFGKTQGTLIYDAADPAKSSVRVSIPVNSIDTHVAALDKDLLGAGFLDAAKYPGIIFASTKVTPAGKSHFVVAGNLTVHGTTRPVTLDVTLNKVGSYPMIDAPALGLGATATFKRGEFGVGGGVPMVGDELEVRISAEAIESHAYTDKILPREKQAARQPGSTR
ncbi:MAG: YceI family protein [Rhodanobacteraceae bacterium]